MKPWRRVLFAKEPGHGSNGLAVLAVIGIVLILAFAQTAAALFAALPKIISVLLLLAFIGSSVVGISANVKSKRFGPAVEQTAVFLLVLVILAILIGAFIFPDASFQYYWRHQFS